MAHYIGAQRYNKVIRVGYLRALRGPKSAILGYFQSLCIYCLRPYYEVLCRGLHGHMGPDLANVKKL